MKGGNILDYKIIGENIKTYRKAKNLTQGDLANLIKKSESSTRKYEKGLVEIPNTVIECIAVALDVDTVDLIYNDIEKENMINAARKAMGLPLTTIELPGKYSEAEIEKIKDYANYIEWKRNS